MDELVKKLQEFISQNKELISERPEILIRLKDRLAKADDPDELSFDDMDFGYQDHDSEDGYEDEDLAGLSEFDPDEEEGYEGQDEADKLLAENPEQQDIPDETEEQAPEESVETPDVSTESQPPKKQYSGRWQPNEANYTDAHRSAIDEHMNNGYSHREAERMAGAHAGPDDFESAYHARHDQEEPSAAFMEQLLPHAHQYIDNWEKHKRMNAEAAKNPELHHAGQIMGAVEDHRKDYDQAWKEFQDSDDFKGMNMFEQMKAQADFKKKFHEDNPDHADNFINLGT